MIKITTTLNKLNSKLTQMSRRYDNMSSLLENVSNDVMKNIKLDTAAAKDVNGVAFVPYTPSYAKQKGSNVVNLKLEGKMLGGLRTKRNNRNRVTLTFLNSQKEKAAKHNRGDANKRIPKRHFFGISRKSRKNISVLMKNTIKLNKLR